MQAAFIEGIRKVVVGEVAEPRAGDDELLIEVDAVGICGSDIHYYLEGAIGAQIVKGGFLPGHEFAGRIVDGPAERHGLKIGELVAVDPATPCGRCEWCHQNHPNLCPHVVFKGAPPYTGAMTRLVTAKSEALFRVPEGFDATDAAMLEPLGVAVHAIDLARPRFVETCAIIGCGAIGLLILQCARAAGIGRIIGVEPVASRRELALELGADEAVGSAGEVAGLTKGRGVDLVIEATDRPEGFQLSAEAARIGGRIVLVGIPEGDSYALQASLARRKGLGVKFSRRMGHVYPRAIELVRRGLVDVRRLATHHFPLAEAPQAFALQADRRDGVIKSILHPA
ncbi:MAG: alcohol dehydrogenase catalytic domain-containing protein [Geminicoccaceae bacterium]